MLYSILPRCLAHSIEYMIFCIIMPLFLVILHTRGVVMIHDLERNTLHMN